MRALSWLLAVIISAATVVHSSADGDTRLPGDRGPPKPAHERVQERRYREAGRRRPSAGTNYVPPPRNARNAPGRRDHGGMQGPNGLKSHVPPTDENHFIVDFVTTAGNFSMEVNPSWSPLGAEHFLQMALEGYYDGQKVFRVIPNFLVQFGYNGDPAETARRMKQPIKDDAFRVSNRRGYVAFAGNARDSRRTNIFINLVDNFFIDHRDVWATPFGRVNSEGMRIVDRFYSGYSQRPPEQQPDQGKLAQYGNAYLNDMFPELTEIVSVTVTTAQLDVHSEL